MTILAARRVLPPDLMTPAKASKPFMKDTGPEAPPPPPSCSRELRSDEKAAIVLFSLGTERAQQLFGQMDASEHKLFAHAFNSLGDLGIEEITDVLLAFTDCLGPCSEANVVFLYLGGRPLWLRRVNEIARFAALLAWARAAVDGIEAPLPPALAALSFSWTGGGEGPSPPIED